MKLISLTFILVFLFTQSFCYAVDLDCIVGECSKGNEITSKEDEYECVCPPKDTIKTIIDIIGVFSIPFELFSAKPNLVPGATSIESLIKNGCKCKLKSKNDNQEE